jgi:glucan endo-1,3-alpha-glucosidase
MPHDGWRDIAAVYIDAYKAGSSSPDVTVSNSVYPIESHLLTLPLQTDELVYYYRPSPKDAACTDPTGKPTGYQYDDDSVFVTAMLTSAGTVTIT